jgi:alkenylglycerophosphocholine/alkenylglycerophosphoethanolamine hydrolase
MERPALPWFLLGVALFFVGHALDLLTLRVAVKALPVLALAWSVHRRGRVGATVAFGLLLGGVGDVVLELGHFLPGLVAFLLGHIAYIVAFVSEDRRLRLQEALPPLLFVAVLSAVCVPAAGTFAAPIVVYGLVIGAMAWRASVRPGWLAVLGAWVFAFSDAMIAINKFVTPLEGIRPVIMVTYWTAQLLIALSVPKVRADAG